MNTRPKSPGLWKKLSSVGPAIIVASVVLGPGSILINSKAGWIFGYDMVWVLALACILMAGMTALSARLGVCLNGTPCEELAQRLGRPVALLTGGSLFMVAASFQFSNNLGVLFALEPYLDASKRPDAAGSIVSGVPSYWPVLVLTLLNGSIITAILWFRNLYKPVELLMKILVGVMVLGFLANLVMSQPSVAAIFSGLLPSWNMSPAVGKPPREMLVVLGLMATTYSVGGAFYQAYLVKQKGWTRDDLGKGLFDSIIGISTLGLLSLMIMVTAASVLHGNPNVTSLNSAADVAKQLEPVFGSLATALFSLGIFAGALSSFLVNAMIGGTVFADACGKGGSMDEPWPRYATIFTLLFGMVVAIAVKSFDFDTGKLIVFAQAITVLGNPLMAAALLWLALRPELRAEKIIPMWMKLLAAIGLVVVTLLSISTVLRLYEKFAVG